MEYINEEVFYKLKKLPIVNQKESVRVYIEMGQQFIVKQLKNQQDNQKQEQIQREIEVAKNLKYVWPISTYLLQIYHISQTQKYTYLIMEKCDGSLDDLFDSQEILSLDFETRVVLIINLFYQIIQGYKHLKSIFPNFIHRDLCLDNIFQKRVNGQFIVKIADYGLSKLVDDTLTFNFNKKSNYYPPEIIKHKGLGEYSDKLDVYTLGVCLYKMIFGIRAKVQHNEFGLDFPNQSIDSYYNLQNLLNQMLQQNSNKRISWADLYQLLYQFPQLLSMKGREENLVVDCQSYLTEKLEQHPLSHLLDAEMKEIAIRFKKLLSNQDLSKEQQFQIITIMKYVYEIQTKVDANLTDNQIASKYQKLRTARYIAITAYEIQLSFIAKEDSFKELLFDFEQQLQIYKSIEIPKNLDIYFYHFKINKLDKNIESRCQIF